MLSASVLSDKSSGIFCLILMAMMVARSNCKESSLYGLGFAAAGVVVPPALLAVGKMLDLQKSMLDPAVVLCVALEGVALSLGFVSRAEKVGKIVMVWSAVLISTWLVLFVVMLLGKSASGPPNI